MTTDEERWVEAEEILRSGPGADAQRRIRKRKILHTEQHPPSEQ